MNLKKNLLFSHAYNYLSNKGLLLCRLYWILIINKDENVHRFALRAIRGELLERERKRDPHNLEGEASIGEGLG